MIYENGDFAICLWGGFRVEEQEKPHEDEEGQSGQAERRKLTKEEKWVTKNDPKKVKKTKHAEGIRKGNLLSIICLYIWSK